MNQILEHQDNDIILSQVLAQKIQDARYPHSSRKVCDDLAIEFCEVTA